MITQTNPPAGPKSNSSDVIKDMSPHSNIPAPSFEDDEFDIHGPQVNNPQILSEFYNFNWFQRCKAPFENIPFDDSILAC